jgi:hypothetical protein
VKREVRQLMSQRAGEVVLIGAEQNGARTGLGDGRPPGGGSAGREGIQGAAIGHDDEAERTRVPYAQTGPLGRTIGGPGQVEGDRPLGRPGDDGDPTNLDGGRVTLEQEDERENER